MVNAVSIWKTSAVLGDECRQKAERQAGREAGTTKAGGTMSSGYFHGEEGGAVEYTLGS